MSYDPFDLLARSTRSRSRQRDLMDRYFSQYPMGSGIFRPQPDPPPDPPPVIVTLDPTIKNAAIVLSSGNMTATLTNGGVQDVVGLATLAITSGKKSWIEFLVGATSDRVAFGIGTASTLVSDTAFLGCTSGNDIGNYSSSAGVWQNGSNLAGSGGFSAGDRVNIAVDTTASSITWYVNNVSQVSVTYSLTGDVFAAYGLRYDSITPAQISLVAPASFVNAPPTGFTKYGT